MLFSTAEFLTYDHANIAHSLSRFPKKFDIVARFQRYSLRGSVKNFEHSLLEQFDCLLSMIRSHAIAYSIEHECRALLKQHDVLIGLELFCCDLEIGELH